MTDSLRNPVLKRIIRLVGKAIGDFGLIQHRDRILVALSGGKDSWTLLYALKHLQAKAPITFELAAATIHPGSLEFDCAPLGDRLREDGIQWYEIPSQIVEVVNENLTDGTNPCSFCSRLRRGMLYTFAAREGWNKIALGHHLDDFIETLLLNLFFNGSIKGMSPNMEADDGRNTIIRPLVYVREDLNRQAAAILDVPILGCLCSYQGMSGSRRQWIKDLLNGIESRVPGVRSSILAAMGRVRHRHLLWVRDDHISQPVSGRVRDKPSS